jgi:hypothetical protein
MIFIYCSWVSNRWQWYKKIGEIEHKRRSNTQNNTQTIKKTQNTQNKKQKYKTKPNIKRI